MNTTPTPRTDAAVVYFPTEPEGEPQPFVPVIISALLERKLTEAQKDASTVRTAWCDCEKDRDKLRAEVDRLRAEVDEDTVRMIAAADTIERLLAEKAPAKEEPK